MAGFSGAMLFAVAGARGQRPHWTPRHLLHYAAGGIVGKALQDFQPFFEREFRTRCTIETIEGAAETKASCHSDFVDDDSARLIQERELTLVEITTP